MAIALRGISAIATVSGAGTLTVSVPAGVVNGDVMILVVETNSGTVHPTTPAGWTPIDSSSTNSPTSDSYVRVASSEPASYGITVAATSGGMIVAYSGADNTTPINAHGAWAKLASSASPVANSITTTVNGCQLVFLTLLSTTVTPTFTPPTGFATTETGSKSMWYADESQASAGATGTATATLGSAQTTQTQLVALAPAAGGGGGGSTGTDTDGSAWMVSIFND